MGGAYCMNGGEKRCIQGFGEETCGKQTIWRDSNVDGRIILRWIFREWHVRKGRVWHGLD